MKKVLYTLLILVVLIVGSVVVALNSSYLLKEAVASYVKERNITYSEVSGNLFSGVEIEGLSFSGMRISKEIRFNWHLSELFYKHIDISEVRAENLDLKALKAMIASFATKETKQQQRSQGEFSFPLIVTVDDLFIHMSPFQEHNITVSDAYFKASNLRYGEGVLEASSYRSEIDSSIGNLHLEGKIAEHKLYVDSLGLKGIDLETILARLQHANGQKNTKEQPKATKETTTKLPIEAVVLSHFALDLKPMSYEGVDVKRASLMLDGFTLPLQKTDNHKVALDLVDLQLLTDVGTVALKGHIADEAVVEQLRVDDINMTHIMALFAHNQNESNLSDTKEPTVITTKMKKRDDNTSTNTSFPAWLPKRLLLKQADVTLLPYHHPKIDLESLTFAAQDLHLSLERSMVEDGNISLVLKSNLLHLLQRGYLKQNRLYSKGSVTLQKSLFETYAPSINDKALAPLALELNATRYSVDVGIITQAKELLKTEGNATRFNIDIPKFHALVGYDLNNSQLQSQLHANLLTPYSGAMRLDATVQQEKKEFHYRANLSGSDFTIESGQKLPLLDGLTLKVEGSQKLLHAMLHAKGLEGNVTSDDFQKGGIAHFKTTQAIPLASFVQLPEALQEAKANVVVDAPFQLVEGALTGEVAFGIVSNVINMKGKITQQEATKKVVADVTLAKNSLLYGVDPNIQWKNITPLHLTLQQEKQNLQANLKAGEITSYLRYTAQSDDVEGKVSVQGVEALLSGKLSGEMALQSSVDSFNRLFKTISHFYTLKNPPKVEGALALSVVKKADGMIVLELESPKILYKSGRKSKQVLQDVHLELSKLADRIIIPNYNLLYNGMHLYATKPSSLKLTPQSVQIDTFWINDALTLTGDLDFKKMQGEIRAKAEKFHFSHELVDLDAQIDITAAFQGENTNVTGDVTVLGGQIHYDLSTKSFPDDSDIVIVQQMKKKEPNPFMDHLSMQININSKEPLAYKSGPVDMGLKLALGVHKAPFDKISLLGSVDIVDGSSYLFEKKKFTFDKSHIYMTGDPNKPMLDVKIKYKALRHVITISVTGTPAVPNILFSSVPSLSKEQILSIILFDSEEAAGKNNAEDMMKMMGGAMAKSALNDLGVEIDHLVLGEGNSVEVGKKISDKVTVIYINGEVPRVEVKYRHSPTVEVVVGASETSQSVDVVYIKDFNLRKKRHTPPDSDIIIK